MMTTPPRKRRRSFLSFGLATAAVITLFGLGSGCGGDDDSGTAPDDGGGDDGGDGGGDVTFPVGWTGVWDVSTTLRECETGVVFYQSTASDTICEGDEFNLPVDSLPAITCTGSVSETTIDLACTGTSTDNGCTTSVGVETNGTRSGETFVATAVVSVTQTGTNCALPGTTCFDLEISGTRVLADSMVCVGDGNPGP